MRISSRMPELGGRLDETANNDKVIMGAGMILFWPSLFALGGTKAQEAMIEEKCAGAGTMSRDHYGCRHATRYDARRSRPSPSTCTCTCTCKSRSRPAPAPSAPECRWRHVCGA